MRLNLDQCWEGMGGGGERKRPRGRRAWFDLWLWQTIDDTFLYIWKPFQLILGLGLPMEVDVSMIIGYVLKFNYVLPYNASYLTDPYVRYDRSISPRVEPDENDTSPSNAKGITFFICKGCETNWFIDSFLLLEISPHFSLIFQQKKIYQIIMLSCNTFPLLFVALWNIIIRSAIFLMLNKF